MAHQPHRAHFRNHTLVIAMVTVGLVALSAIAGDLAPPPGAIQPTDRVTINPQAIGSLPYVISAPGSYVLTGNITAPAGHNSHGILIKSDDVTLDLNGFTLIGVPGAFNAVEVDGAAGGHFRITVMNGVASGGWNAGFALVNAEESRAFNLKTTGGGSIGIQTGRYCIVDHCVSSDNNLTGITVGVGSIVTNCVVKGNGTIGIYGEFSTVVKDCVAFNNQFDGIKVQNISVVENCSTYLNAADGIDATDSLVRGCASGSNLGLQINTNGGSCTLADNH